jgi:hypothetical protein
VKAFILFACVFLVSVGGCAPLMDAQSNLIAQARRGIDVAQANQANVAVVYDELARVKRQRLDDAFDADVRERDEQGDLTAAWVIAHRSAYAAGLEAYAKQDQSLRASDAIGRRNLQAVDAALERLQFLQSIQNRWLAPTPPRPQPEDER